MRIYIAARYTRREEMTVHAKRLLDAGHLITSSWIYGQEEGMSRPEIADMDLIDVEHAQTVISFTEPFDTLHIRGGRHVEFGYGLALKKRSIIIGERENVFHWYSAVEQYDSLDAFFEANK